MIRGALFSSCSRTHRQAASSFAEIAEREGRAERHIRFLAPLAFLSPRIIAAIIDRLVPVDITVTGLAKALAHCWTEQERKVGLPRSGPVSFRQT
jgi:site-specific DNA recombinase